MLLEIDSRDQPGNPRSGTYITLLGARYRDLDDFGYDFSRVGGEIQYYFPVFDKKRVFAVRGAFNRYDPAAGSAVPFYYMLPVGGKDSIRGFTDFRFRDLTAVLLNAEYRWEAFAGLDMALFYDLGDAAHDWDDLSFGDLKHSYGIGLRFNTYRSIFMRTEVAFGSGEGTRFFVAFGGPLRLERYSDEAPAARRHRDMRRPRAPRSLVAGGVPKFFPDDPLPRTPRRRTRPASARGSSTRPTTSSKTRSSTRASTATCAPRT